MHKLRTLSKTLVTVRQLDRFFPPSQDHGSAQYADLLAAAFYEHASPARRPPYPTLDELEPLVFVDLLPGEELPE